MDEEISLEKEVESLKLKNKRLRFTNKLAVGALTIMALTANVVSMTIKPGNYFEPTKARVEYINQDSLPDLVYKTGETYLQTKEGNFVSYKDVLQQKKAKLDSTYRAKADSLKKVYKIN